MQRRAAVRCGAACSLGVILAMAASSSHAEVARPAARTTLISVSSSEMQGNGGSAVATISADGTQVAFESGADNLVPNDANASPDIFVRNRRTGTTEIVSIASDGTRSNNYSLEPEISADGSVVVFQSYATNLVPGDTNGDYDIFAHDRATGETTRVSVTSNGQQVEFQSSDPAVSGDGRMVAFEYAGDDLVPGDSNKVGDIFVHDRQTGETRIVSVASDGTSGNGWSLSPSLSRDGRYVAFFSYARNLAPHDTNHNPDVFVHDLLTGKTTIVSMSSREVRGNRDSTDPALSAHGRLVSFLSRASNLVPQDRNHVADVFVRDRRLGTTERVSVASDGTEANNYCGLPTISDSGRFVAFESIATNLDHGIDQDEIFEDVFRHDRQTGNTVQVSVSTSGEDAELPAHRPDMSANGSLIVFEAEAHNLVRRDRNFAYDIFLRRQP